jgi:hypothetical protein
MTARAYQHELVSAVATCDRCAFNVHGNNAQALAARHHDAKGHRTHVEIKTRISYGALFGKTKTRDAQRSFL